MVGMDRAGTAVRVDGAEAIAAASWTDYLQCFTLFWKECFLILAPILGILGSALGVKKSAGRLK